MAKYCIINNKRMYNISRFCTECGSIDGIRPSKIDKRDLCFKHYMYESNHGKINKTRYERNGYIFTDDTCEIILCDNNINEIGRAIIDKGDYNLVKDYKWHMNKYGYAVGRKKDCNYVWLQNLIMDNINLDFTIDHKNRNSLDYRKSNLRISDKSTNAMNCGVRDINTSGVTGVMWVNHQGCWCGNMSVKGERKTKHSKSFDVCVKHRLIFESLLAKEFSPNYNFDTQTIQLTYLSHDDNLQTFIEVDLQGQILQFKKL